MKMLLLLFVAGLALLLGSCRPIEVKTKKTLVAIIFCDVTNSLTKGENQRVGNIAANIVHALPDGSIFKLYPIQVQTQIPVQIKIDLNGNNIEDEEDYKVPLPPDNVKARELAAVRQENDKTLREQIQKGVDVLYDQLNKGPDNRTCILNALGFASNYIGTNYEDAEKYDVRMFLISDMIEECNSTPLPGGAVEMDKRDISGEIQRAGTVQAGYSTPNNSTTSNSTSNKPAPGNVREGNPRFNCNLAETQIYCVFPSANDTSGVPGARRPSRDDVKIFWGEIFKACGFKDGQPRDERIIWVDSGDLTGLLSKLKPGRT